MHSIRNIYFVLFASLAAAFAQPANETLSAKGVLAKVTQAYASVTSIHVAAQREDTFAQAGRTSSAHSDCELTARGRGHYSVRMKRDGVDAMALSDGENTWKTLASKKQWSLLAAASSENAEANVESRDLHSFVAATLFGQYGQIARMAEEPMLIREEDFKLGHSKLRCYLVHTRFADSDFDLWVDRERFLVLQSKQRHSVRGTQVETRVKTVDLEINQPIEDSAFRFDPPKGWTEVEMIMLPGEEGMILAGSRAANFTLKTLEGEPVTLDEARGKVVVLDFWATWCGPCRRELPTIEKLRAEFAGKVAFFGVNDEDSGTVREFLKKNHYELAVLMDGKRQVHRQYGVSAIPTLLIIDRQGVIREHFIGSRTEASLRKAIQSAVSAN